MDRALLLLLWLRWQGWLRRISRNLLTARGIVMAVFVLFAMGSCLLSFLVGPSPIPVAPDNVRRYGTLGLLAFCLMNLLFSTFERAIYFTPAEVNFLFPGPFSRRGLLAYKIASNFAIYLFSGLFMTFFFRQYWTWFVAAYLGVVLTLMFLQLFGMLTALVVTKVGAKVLTRPRKLLFVALVALVIVLELLVEFGSDISKLVPSELLDRLEQTAIFQVVLAPLHWFVEVFISTQLWPDLVRWSALALAVNAGLLLMVMYLLDARYLEVAASASERIYARIQMMRSGVGSIGAHPKGKVRRSLPSLPWWGGLGPIAWRQLTTASRNWGRLILLAFFFACMMSPLVVGAKTSDRAVPMAPGLIALLMSMTIFLTPGVPFDFRGDVDRMDILKSLPIPGFWLATGQLVAPVVLVTLIQWGVLALVQIVTGRVEPFLLAAAAVVLPFNFLLFALENLLFLLFPTRLMPWTPGDFQMIGRHMLLFFGRILCLGLALVSAGLVGGLVYFIAGRSWPPALIAAWFVLAAYAIGMIPLVALAFRKFDVAHDTPP